jgi:uncharacterized protein
MSEEVGTLKSFDSGPFLNRAKAAVEDWVCEHKYLDPKDFELRTVWFAKVLDNWKAILCTSLHDTLIFEVTYSGKNRDLCVDVYNKIDSVRIQDGTA